MDDGKGEGWSPAMASSPEATMLDCATVEHRAASPALISRLAQPPDISDNNANPAPVPSDQDTHQTGAERLAPADTQAAPGADRLASAEEAVTAADSTVGEVAAGQPENLTDNFSFLAARGLISSSEGSGEASTSSINISSTSNEVEEKVVGCDSSSSVVAPSTQTQVADSSSDTPGPT